MSTCPVNNNSEKKNWVKCYFPKSRKSSGCKKETLFLDIIKHFFNTFRKDTKNLWKWEDNGEMREVLYSPVTFNFLCGGWRGRWGLWGQLLTCLQQGDVVECLFWLPFQGSDSCLASPPGICSHLLPYSKSGWSQLWKTGFCDLTFTFCTSVPGLHYLKKKKDSQETPFLWPWKLHGKSTAKLFEAYMYLWMTSGPLTIRNRTCLSIVI